jgi:hypothetical protein
MMAEVPSSDEIKVVYGSADFRALYRACRSCKRNAILLLLVVPAVFGALSYGDGVRGVGLVYYALPYLLIAAITVLTFYLFSPWYTVRLRRKNGWNEPMIVQLAKEGISIRHPSQSSIFYWQRLRDVVVRGQRLFLFTTASCAIILPRRSFASDEQFANWAEHAQECWRTAKGATAQ